jgi:flavin-binding protein dodecin
MVIKIIELVGVSKESYEDAVKTAVERASKTVKNITGVDVLGMSAKVANGTVSEYRANLKVAFVVED